MDINESNEVLLNKLREAVAEQLRESRYEEALQKKLSTVVTDSRLGGLAGDYDGGMYIALHLTNKTCMYFWGMLAARDYVRTKQVLSQTELFKRNERNCILYAEALRKIPALRRLYKHFIKEIKRLGSVNNVLIEYAETHNQLMDDLLGGEVNKLNAKLEKRMSIIKSSMPRRQTGKHPLYCSGLLGI